MDSYIISCCSTADLSEQQFADRQIPYICFHYEIDGRPYLDDLGKSMSFAEFYRAMANGAETKTSQVNAEEFMEFFEPYLKEGKDILHLSLSSGLSGVFNSANIAKEELLQKYPERTIYIVDSLAASSGYGLFMDKLADLRDGGMSLDELYNWAETNKLRLHHWFFSTDLSFFIKGGRISKTAGMIGNVLNICPLLNVDANGHLIPRLKIRGKKKVTQAIVEKMKEHAANGTSYNEKCYISHSACPEDAQAVARLVEETFHELNGAVEIFNIGTTIGSHTGPGTVALFFWGSERKD